MQQEVSQGKDKSCQSKYK